MPSLPARALLGLIQLYKWTASPLIGRACRYLPTCSTYAADAVRAHGAWAGAWMATARLCRCHPFGRSGWDPAPDSLKQNSWWRPWRYGDWAWRTRPISSPASEASGGGAPRGTRAVGVRSSNVGRAAAPSAPACAGAAPPQAGEQTSTSPDKN